MKEIEKIKQVKKDKCCYPGCESKSMMQVMLPVGELTESGQIEFLQEGKETSVQSSCSLCDYHFIFAQKKIINLVNQENMIRLVAPTELVELVEGIIEAKEFQKAMKNGKSSKKSKKMSKLSV